MPKYVLIDSLGKKYTKKPGRKKGSVPSGIGTHIQRYDREWKQQRRLALMDILGGRVCIKCGFKDVKALQFDHKKGKGRKDREKHGSNHQLVTYYFHHPDKAKKKLQVMCANCNWIKKVDNKEVHRRYQ